MSSAHPLPRLLRYAGPHRRVLRRAVGFSIANKVLDLAPPALIGLAMNALVDGESSWLGRSGFGDSMSQIYWITGATVVIFAFESLFEYMYRLSWRNLGQAVQHEVRVDAYANVQRIETAWFEERGSGELMSVLNDDVNQLERFLDVGANDLLQVTTIVLVVGTAFFVASPMLCLLAMLPMPLIVWGSVRFQRMLAPRYADVRSRVGWINARLANNLGGIATIKSFTAEEHEVARLRGESVEYREANRRAIALSSAFTPLIRMVILCGLVATLLYGGWLVKTGVLVVGTYATVLFLTQRMLWPLTRLGETFDLYQRAMASTARIFALLDRKPVVRDGGAMLALAGGRIEFEGVTFGYVDGSPILDGISLTAEAGRTTAIVGATGSGKTTLIKLLLRFWDVTDGVVRVDGQDVRDLDLGDLRGAIGLVSQDVFLFHGSVLENIAYGRRNATREEVIEAAKSAEAHDFIEALPQGYETIVGERGQKLSGGQRQRISIARAILKDPPILVLDEATSSVDNETEAAIQRSLAKVAVGRTTLVIAHRLSTVRHASKIWVLARGQVREVGTHDELVAQRGLYASLWKVQTGTAVAV